MRDREEDEEWIRARVRERADDIIYITPNHYDGGYEVRAGTIDFFVGYESIDGNDVEIFDRYL